MICASCGERAEAAPCGACGQDPLLDGHYRLDEELGRGASGTTFRASDVRSGVAVAIKEMPLGRAPTDKARELVQREAAVLAQLHHPGIPAFLESRVVGSGRNLAVMLVQELVEGRDLHRELAERRFTVPEVLHVARDLLGILTYLHGLSPPIVHRDLKPGNVMRRPNGELVLLDFGAVRDSLRDLDGSGSTVAGTFGYMAPEQLVGDATPMSDLYALGALMVHLLSRIEPQKMLAVGGGLDWEGRVSVPAGLRALLRDLLVPDPDERRQRLGDTAAVARRVESLLADPTSGASAPAPLPAHRVQRSAGPAGAITAGLLTAVAAAAAVASIVLEPGEQVSGSVPQVHEVPVEAPPPPPPPQPPPPVERVEVGLGDLPPLGQPGAPVTVVAFSDYQCPYCAKADASWQELIALRPGQVALYWRDLPLAFHKHARPAAHAARCAAEQGRWEDMHDRLLEDQRSLSAEYPYEAARDLGLDTGRFRECMASGRHEAAIERDLGAAKALGVDATPTFFVNGEKVSGARPVDALREVVDRALER